MNFRFTIYDLRLALPHLPFAICHLPLICIALQGANAAASASNLADGSSIVIRNSSIPTVGLEGRIEIVLPGTLLEAKAVEHKAKLVLRIAETRRRGEAIWYDLRYVGMVPGQYDLRGYLMRADGSSTNDLPLIPVTVAPLLPEKHNGQLIEPLGSRLRRLGGYKILMIAVGAVWAAVFIPLVWRKRSRAVQAAPPPAEPTLAERLRPLVEQAAQGTLSRDGQAQLERMLLTHWRQKLNLEGLPMVEAVVKLREHSDAGELLRALESWLHRPPGSAMVNVNAVLEPYKNLPAEDAATLGNSK
jgi:hypothetical protein